MASRLDWMLGREVFHRPNLTAMQTTAQKKGGWLSVTYREPTSGRELQMKMRTTVFNELVKSGAEKYNTAQGRVYSHMIKNSRQGELFTARRQVEGMLKVAYIKDDQDMIATIQQVLQGSDEEVEQFRQWWLDTHSDEEIKEYYDYDPAMRRLGNPRLWDEDGTTDWTRFIARPV